MYFGRYRQGRRDHGRTSDRTQGNRIRIRRLMFVIPKPFAVSPSAAHRIFVVILLAAIASILCFSRPPHALAQNSTDQPTEEIVANLSAGRIIIIVTKDAIVVGTVENPFEVQTHPPTPI